MDYKYKVNDLVVLDTKESKKFFSNNPRKDWDNLGQVYKIERRYLSSKKAYYTVYGRGQYYEYYGSIHYPEDWLRPATDDEILKYQLERLGK